jgi:hypothetical protein
MSAQSANRLASEATDHQEQQQCKTAPQPQAKRAPIHKKQVCQGKKASKAKASKSKAKQSKGNK